MLWPNNTITTSPRPSSSQMNSCCSSMAILGKTGALNRSLAGWKKMGLSSSIMKPSTGISWQTSKLAGRFINTCVTKTRPTANAKPSTAVPIGPITYMRTFARLKRPWWWLCARPWLLPLDDLLVVTREFIHATVSRSGLDRCLRRPGPLSTPPWLSKGDNYPDTGGLVGEHVSDYNTECLHSAIGYITPKDKLEGRAQAIFETRREKLALAQVLREQRWAVKKSEAA
jgi:hypothetical protein